MNPKNWTLRTRLIALTVALVTATSIVIGGVMFFMVRSALLGNFDGTLDNSLQRLTHAEGGPGRGANIIDPKTVVAEFPTNGAAVSGIIFDSETTSTALKTAQLRAIAPAAQRDDGDHESVDVPGLGSYRFVVATNIVDRGTGNPVRLVVGVPLTSLYKQIGGFLVLVAFVVLLAIVLSAAHRRAAAPASDATAQPGRGRRLERREHAARERHGGCRRSACPRRTRTRTPRSARSAAP